MTDEPATPAVPKSPIERVSEAPSDEYAAAAAVESHLVFHANKHISFVQDDGTVIHMRPPTVAQFRTISEAYAAANDFTRQADGRGATRKLYGRAGNSDGGADELPEPSPYTEAFCVAIAETSNAAPPEPAAMPMWAAAPELFNELHEHWRKIRIVVEPAPDVDAQTPPGGHGPAADNAAATSDDGRDGLPVFDPYAPPPPPVFAGGMRPGAGTGNVTPTTG